MALPTTTVAEAAVQSLFDALAAYKTIHGGVIRSAVHALQEVKAALRVVYAPKADFTVTDTADADLTAFFRYDGPADADNGELADALGRAPRVGDVFQVAGTGDTTDNALATAKGGAVADNDLFVVSNVETPAVIYLADTLASMAANESADFTFPA
jgi:hypothetical protein